MRGSIRAFASPDYGRPRMSTTVQGQPVAASGITADEIELRRSFWHAALHFCRREPLGAIGMLIVIVMAVGGAVARLVAPYSPTPHDFIAITQGPRWGARPGADQVLRGL